MRARRRTAALALALAAVALVIGLAALFEMFTTIPPWAAERPAALTALRCTNFLIVVGLSQLMVAIALHRRRLGRMREVSGRDVGSTAFFVED
jgi:hypothetical protein